MLELAECNTFGIKSAWNSFFGCLDKLNLYEYYRKRTRYNVSKKKRKNNKQNSGDLVNTKSVTDFRKYFRPSLVSDQSTTSDGAEFSRSRMKSPSSSTSTLSFSSTDSAAIKQLINNSDCSSDSSSNSSIHSLMHYESSFSGLTHRFDSHKIRINSLKQIFDIFLKISSNSSYVLKVGSFGLINCAVKYLQYSISLKIDCQTNLDIFDISQENESFGTNDDVPVVSNKLEDSHENEGDFSAYILQERHFQITADYSHLSKISNSHNSNTLVKPFLTCLEKLLNILLSEELNIENLAFNVGPIARYSIFQLYSYKIKNIATLKASSLRLALEKTIEKYNLDHEQSESISKNLEHENEDDFKVLNQKLSIYLSSNDKLNLFKIICFLVQSITDRVYLAYDELNSVQIVEYLYEFIKRIIISKKFVLACYCILEILLKKIDIISELLEFEKNPYSNESKLIKIREKLDLKQLINKKLHKNTFFMSSLMNNLISKTVRMFTLLTESFRESSQFDSSESSLLVIMLNCTLSRFNNILTKCVLRKFNSFDSVVEINVINISLEKLYLSCLKLNYESMTLKCFQSIKFLHELSLIPSDTIIKEFDDRTHEKNIKNSNDDFEMQTKLCKYFSVKFFIYFNIGLFFSDKNITLI